MNDIGIDFRSLPILDPERQAYHAEVRSFQAHKVQDFRRRLRVWSYLAISSLAINGALISALTILLPLKTVIPLFLVVNSDGTVDTGVSLADLGVDQAQKVIRASIWRYVSERESYTYADAKHRYDLVSLMSDQNVQRDYQSWFTRSPDAPQQKYGRKGQISIKEISMIFVRDGVAEVRFARSEGDYGAKQKTSTGTATVEFELLNNAPSSLILDDPAAIRVVRYSVEENSVQ